MPPGFPPRASCQLSTTHRSLGVLRVEHGEAFQSRNLTESLVRSHQCIYPDTMLHVQGHGKLERVQGSQALPVTVSDDKTLRRRIVEFVNRHERDCAACDVIKKSNAQCGGSFGVEMTGARFQIGRAHV